MIRLLLAAAALSFCTPATSQTVRPAYRPGGAATDTNPQPVQCREWNSTIASWSPCVGGEVFSLVAANTPAAAATVYGGAYVLAQACTSYGTVTVRYRGPDGATMLPLLSKTAPDAGGGTLLSLGSGAVIDATITGGAGCNVSLSRVP